MRLDRFTILAPLVHLAGPVILLSVTLGLSAYGKSTVRVANAPPWESQYKIKPDEKTRLTAADVVGPDGIVYPNWTKCGVQGGIPEVKAVASVEDFGAKADDDADDSEALAKACRAAGKMGGGAVLLGEGVYYMDRPVTIRHNNVVIRGKGSQKSRLVFRYSIPEAGVAFYNPSAGDRVGRNTRLEMHCKPAGLEKMTMSIDDTVIGNWSRSQHSGNTFAFGVSGRNAMAKVPDGRHVLKGVAEYTDGKKCTGEIPIVLDSAFNDTEPVADIRAAITFAGTGSVGKKLKLAKDGKRGDMTLDLESTDGLKVGDCILIDGPATERWKKLTKNACKWGTYRFYEVVIQSTAADRVSCYRRLLRAESRADPALWNRISRYRTDGKPLDQQRNFLSRVELLG
jgi:hypothetical protein